MAAIAVDGRVLQTAPYTGVSLYALNILLAWAKHGEKEKFKIYFNSHKKMNLPSDLKMYDCHQYYLPNKLLNVAWSIQEHPKLNRYVDEKTIWVPNINYLPTIKNKNLVLSVHDLSWFHFPEFFSYRRRWWHHLIKFKSLLSEARLIIADSNFTKQDIIKTFKIPNNKVAVVPLGVDWDYYQNLNPVDVMPVLPKKYILYLGALEPRKNIPTIISCFNILARRDKDLHLVLAGPIGWLSKPIFSAIKKSHAKFRIIYYGYLSNEQKRHLLQRSQVFLFPSFYEGFGLPPLEAMASGVPVVAGAVSSLPEVMSDAALLINPHQTNELVDAVWEILQNKELANLLVSRGFERAKFYTWENSAAKLLQLLEEVNS